MILYFFEVLVSQDNDFSRSISSLALVYKFRFKGIICLSSAVFTRCRCIVCHLTAFSENSTLLVTHFHLDIFALDI